MTSTPVTLSLTDVTLLSRRNEQILGHITFTVNQGETLAVVGPNGSGKSSLLHTIIRQQSHDLGDINLNGQPLNTLPARERARQIAFLSQTDVPDFRLTLEDYVALGRLPHAGKLSPVKEQQIIHAAIEDTGVQAFKHRPLSQLSGGQRQRAALARALAQMPSLLLLDELTNHLDPSGRVELLSVVKSRGIAVVAVLHDLQLAQAFADKVLVLCKGKQVICDIPDRALHSGILFPVFGMTSVDVSHPENGKILKIFEIPSVEMIEATAY
ncbi:ABC transporter ATP-binding protein [Budvicia diplopodorum]|uniref:ABC transporter ATP-binding protein n=1 Tax=Budvicia diplopodorum TaxID=1119056 RepID=UPI00135CCF03|nr:ABC transporter ATP-binding protein [Budvicia diplopodorum]